MEADYFRLLEYEKKLKLEGKNLLKENEEDFKKLLAYQVSFLDHFRWKQKNRYFLLITNFLDKKIDLEQYMCELYELQRETRNQVDQLKSDLEKLKKFEPNSSSKGFSMLIEYLCSDCRVCEPDPELRDDSEISETELIEGLRTIFSQMQEYS